MNKVCPASRCLSSPFGDAERGEVSDCFRVDVVVRGTLPEAIGHTCRNQKFHETMSNTRPAAIASRRGF
jgi:hypothetical protein